MTEPITRFDGRYRWLSNFWACFVTFDGREYQSTEAAYQAAKTIDLSLRAPFESYFASKAKEEGGKLPLRADWEDVKLGIMEDLNRQKFANNAELRARLLDTGDADLVETNTWGDTFWGRDHNTGEGENHLGRILMRIRDELRPRVPGPEEAIERLSAEWAEAERAVETAEDGVRAAKDRARDLRKRVAVAKYGTHRGREHANAMTVMNLREAIADAAREHGAQCVADQRVSTTPQWEMFRALLAVLAERAR